MWQGVVVGIIVLVAGGGTVWSLYRRLTGRGACDCGAKPNCPFRPTCPTAEKRETNDTARNHG